MKLRSLVFSTLVLLSSWPADTAFAMSVRPPTFPELVAEASTVVRVRVVRIDSRAVIAPDGQRVVKTFVTFATIKPVKGESAKEFTLSFLGGTAEGETLEIPGMPVFRPDDEEFLFTTGKQTICPLVGAMHGRYRVLNDAAAGRRYMARDNSEPLTATAEVIEPNEPPAPNRRSAAAIAAALTPEQFEQAVLAEIAHPTRSTANK